MKARIPERLRSALTFLRWDRNWLPAIPVGSRAMNARLISAITALMTITACSTDDGSGAWDGLRCWETSSDPVCIGSIDGESVRVIPPSVFYGAVDAGRYSPMADPTCPLDTEVEYVECYEPESRPGATVCVGSIKGVLVPTADPCGVEPDWAYVDVFGLYAWPDDGSEHADLSQITWPD